MNVSARNSGDPLVPLHLLVYAVQTAVTTMTCIADYLSWEGVSMAEKAALGWLYVPYLAVCEYRSFTMLFGGTRADDKIFIAVFMGVDMFGRLQDRLVKI